MKTNYRKRTAETLAIISAVGELNLKTLGVEVPKFWGTTLGDMCNYYSAMVEQTRRQDSDDEFFILYEAPVYDRLWKFFEAIQSNPQRLYLTNRDDEGTRIVLYNFFRKLTWGRYKNCMLDCIVDDDEAKELFLTYRKAELAAGIEDDDTFLDILLRLNNPEDMILNAVFFIWPFTTPYVSHLHSLYERSTQ